MDMRSRRRFVNGMMMAAAASPMLFAQQVMLRAVLLHQTEFRAQVPPEVVATTQLVCRVQGQRALCGSPGRDPMTAFRMPIIQPS